MDDIILAAFLREPLFYANYSSIVDSSMFDGSTHRIAINLYVDYINTYMRMPTEDEMYADLTRYCTKYGIDASMKQATIEQLQRCYKMNYNVNYAKDNFIKYATKNKLTAAVIKAAETIKGKDDELSEKDYNSILENIQEAITIRSRSTEGVSLADVADDPVKYIQDNNRYDVNKIVKTGIPTLDAAHIAGGPLPGELCVVAAPPGRGKSTLLINVGAHAILSGHDVIHIFVGDNTEADGVLRYCARLTGVSMPQIMLKSSQYVETWKYMKENFHIGNLILGAYPIGSPTMSDIRSFITKNMIRRSIVPKLLIIDYIDNCRRDDDDNSYESLGVLYTQMKNICEEMQLVGWTASQPKVDTWDTDINAGLSSLAESSKKQHVLDILITMNKRNDQNYSIYVPKFRRGRSDFSVDLIVDYERMLIKESLVSRANVPSSSGVNPTTYNQQANNANLPPSPFTGK